MEIRIKKKCPSALITSVIIICIIALAGIHNSTAAQDISFKTNISRAIQNPSNSAKRLDLELAMHVSDGFATAGTARIEENVTPRRIGDPRDCAADS